MTNLNIQQVISAKYRTSAAADALTKELMDLLGLSTKAAVARLAIGRSLGGGPLPDELIDAKGVEIQSTTIFKQEDIAFWVSLILSHDLEYSATPSKDPENLRQLVRRHWHRGVHLLKQDWLDSDSKYEMFVTNLVSRKAELDPSNGVPRQEQESVPPSMPAEDMAPRLVRALQELGVAGEVKEPVHGLRVSRYKVILKDINKLQVLRGHLEELGSLLNLGTAIPTVATADEAKAVFIDLARPQPSWKRVGAADFTAALSELPTTSSKLLVCPGVDMMGKNVVLDVTNAPHVLVGGATNQGKSVCMHCLILSLVKQHGPQNVQLALIDPKQVEFSAYERLPHLWNGEIASGSDAALLSIRSLTEEMDHRYSQLRAAGVNNIVDGRGAGLSMPFIVVCIDELADLVLQESDVVEGLVRLAQMGRGAGVHLIVATQRPDASTLPGLLRSNIPTRIALRVQKSTESKIILDQTGAESLLGSGDMLIKTGGDDAKRVHGYYLSLNDVKSLVSPLKG